MEIELSLTIDEAQKVLNALVKEPYGEVYELINKIQEQSSEQLSNNNNNEVLEEGKSN